METNMKLLSLLEKNENFNTRELAAISEKSSALNIALGKYKKVLFAKMDTPKKFTLTKDNLENLFLEPLNSMRFKYIIAAMDINKWTIKDLFEKCQQLDMNIMMVVGCPNPIKEKVLV